MIEKLENKKEEIISGQVFDAKTNTYKNIYTEILREPNVVEIKNKINEIIDYINKIDEERN